jgi:transposase
VETIVERPAALDVHKAQVTACVRVPNERGEHEERIAEFATTVRGLLALGDWLSAHAVQQVVMEATGVYWKAPWAILEDEFECLLVNARHVKQVPGRKTDVSDAAWLCRLAEAGLLKASFVPPKPIRQLRNLTRYRKTQIQERAREVNRLHKALEDAGIKLDCVAADVMGKSGRDMLDALVAGETDPDVLAQLARRQMRKKIPPCAKRWWATSTSTTASGLARFSPTSTSSTSTSSACRRRSRSSCALSRRRLNCCARSWASSAAAPSASWPRSAPT